MEVKNVAVYGMYESMIASGYPMLAKTPTERGFSEDASVLYALGVLKDDDLKETKDFKRITKLANTPLGSGHANALKGIIVQFDVDFTIKVWTEAERYHFFDFVSSCSTMHRLKSMDLDKGYCEHVDKRVVEIMKELQKESNENPTQENMYKMLYTKPCGLKLTATMTTNYLQLKTIYWQRRNHRLKEWQDFCKWIETLPHAKELICGE